VFFLPSNNSHPAFREGARDMAPMATGVIYNWRRSVLLTIIGGMAVYLPVHLMLDW
jgi:hypothetical protein